MEDIKGHTGVISEESGVPFPGHYSHVHCMGQIDLFDNYLYSTGIIDSV